MSRTLDQALGEYHEMPTVGGDPVVESGSNSDGAWTRWADGTQVCSYSDREFEPEKVYSSTEVTDTFTWTHPADFTEIISRVVGNDCDTPNPEFLVWAARNSSSLTSTRIRGRAWRDNTPLMKAGFSIVARGYWK